MRRKLGRLQAEIDNLVKSIASGVPGDTVAPAIREREVQLTRVKVALNAPRPETPDLDTLRAALEQRSEQWKKDLRAEPKVARMLLRRLIGPIELWEDEPLPDFVDKDDDRGAEQFVNWEAKTDVSALLDRDYRLVKSPTGFEPVS